MPDGGLQTKSRLEIDPIDGIATTVIHTAMGELLLQDDAKRVAEVQTRVSVETHRQTAFVKHNE